MGVMRRDDEDRRFSGVLQQGRRGGWVLMLRALVRVHMTSA
jgi:hypothetical protein